MEGFADTLGGGDLAEGEVGEDLVDVFLGEKVEGGEIHGGAKTQPLRIT